MDARQATFYDAFCLQIQKRFWLLGDVLCNPKTDLLGDDIPMHIQLQWHANYSYPCSQCLSVIRCLQCLVTDVHCYHTEVLRDCHYMWCYSDDVCHMTAP